ncbi:response regulator [Carboxydochorda subterranea]|uniref:Response regulator n=1 Tax=Carboxydichorda subterranea TaxID=3109565 RepID=A0ABZ1BYI9_9FIRM|nr:response regulator [Limnochorda sp. L945t]WRP17890.1 response regulator [Limnochorda sp. L945t]
MGAKRILITDDTAFMRVTLRRVLESNGFEVVGEAEDGMDAVQKYVELKPDVVTMDITMPKMDGITAIRKIMEIDPQARIIVCSAMGQKPMVIEALNAGAKDFLVKPFQPQRVLEAIQKVGG